jgi:transcriptional regulator of nitric oxide reductase
MAVPSKESSFADEANNTGREEETATDTNQTNDTGVDPNVTLTTSVDLVSDESMQENPLEVAHSGGIIVNDRGTTTINATMAVVEGVMKKRAGLLHILIYFQVNP